MNQVLETDRLVLRQLTLADADSLLVIFSDVEAMRFYPAIKNREETLEWIGRNLESYRGRGSGLWAVLLKDNNEFVGQCGLIYQPDVDGRNETEIGYLFV